MIYRHRDLEEPLKKAAEQFRVLALTGARQTGKSTLLRRLFGNTHRYVTLDDPRLLRLAQQDPELFFQEHKGPLILDEVQYAPDLLPYVKMRVDSDGRKGQFILTGSQQFPLMKGLRETLAGRIALFQLYPLSVTEGPSSSSDYIVRALRGSYPEPLLTRGLDPARWYASYLATYLERDVQFHYRLEHPERFRDLMALLAARTAQALNMNALSNDLGISVPTVKSWIGILEASQIVYRLRPYHVNLGSRLVKTPKIYFTDIGLVCHLAGSATREAVLRGPLAGALFENFVVQEALKIFAHSGRPAPLFYYRTNNNLEVDLIVEKNPRELVPIEIKLSKTPHPGMAGGITRLRALQGKTPLLLPGYVVCLADRSFPLSRADRAVSWRELPSLIK